LTPAPVSAIPISTWKRGLKVTSRLAGTDVTLPNLTHILITHGHIDHFGGLSYVRPLTPANVGIHELISGSSPITPNVCPWLSGA